MNKKLKILLPAAIVIIPVLLSPFPRFRNPLSTVVMARDSSILGARIADDGQWRFAPSGNVPDKFVKSLLAFEDRYFYYHPGVNPVSLVRAVALNAKANDIVSGGSTVTMQVARLSGGIGKRSYLRKSVEILSALKLELFRSKKEILKMYAANAPFGGNTVGLEAAAWRYTGKPSSAITWSEAATLAVLPNAPSLVFPGKNQQRLKERRDNLLRELYRRGTIDSMTMILSIDEPLPGEPRALPALAPHITDHFFIEKKGKNILTTIDKDLQGRASEIINNHQRDLAGNMINNIAALIVKVESGEVLAYIGNSTLKDARDHGEDVDIVRSPRSTGSILKPILYAALQESGGLLPNTLIADIPTRFSGFAPKNFDQTFSGAVTASSALAQSLNIPAVRMLRDYDPARFLNLLQCIGFTTFKMPADHYGLSLILGGGETTLWELTGVYASLSRVLSTYNRDQKYYAGAYHPPLLTAAEKTGQNTAGIVSPPLSAASIWLTYEALRKVNRPGSETGWQYFSSTPDLAWKTGTSFGFRDAWAIGTTPDYVIGVWVGNADGEGRPGLTGITAAAPVLFDLVNIMPRTRWFNTPFTELIEIKVCKSSGYKAGPDCPETELVLAGLKGERSSICPFHKLVHLNIDRTFQVNADCAPQSAIRTESWFILPPAMEYFYRQKNPGYITLPPWDPACRNSKDGQAMEFIYPVQGIRIFIPRDHSGQQARFIGEIIHRNPSKKIFWHLDNDYKGSTRHIHQMEFFANGGNHILTAVDEDGNTIKTTFSITGPE